MALYTGKLLPREYLFSLFIQVYERVKKSLIPVCKKDSKGLWDAFLSFMAVKKSKKKKRNKQKRSGLWFIQILKIVHLQKLKKSKFL